MKLIANSTELVKEFSRLCRKYENYYWTIAWASTSNKFFKTLNENKEKIKKIVVGLHFYQTHPDFIEAFRTNNNVRFIKQTEGTFHPKVYLFYTNENEWEAIVGSPNFTNEAFTRNCEASMLITSDDNDSKKVLQSTLNLLKTNWNDGTMFTKDELSDYRVIWNNQRPKINSLSGLYGGTKTRKKQFYNAPIAKKSWQEYVKEIQKEKRKDTNERLKVLSEVRKMFESVEHFNELELDEMKFIAGIKNKHQLSETLDWGWFGSMEGAGDFKKLIIDRNKHISKALDFIPLKGQITESHYMDFIAEFKKISKKKYLAPATRLLAMKRPDVFVCVDGMNRKKLCLNFGIIQSNMSYERYWTDIVASIFDSEWWQHPKPKTNFELSISQSRAAFLDSLYYERKNEN